MAPLALLLALVAVVAVIQGSSPGSSSSAPATTPAALHHAAHHARPRPTSYVVQPGDTLSVIAAKTHVSLATIQQLNPNVDPQALQTGQRIKLSP